MNFLRSVDNMDKEELIRFWWCCGFPEYFPTGFEHKSTVLCITTSHIYINIYFFIYIWGKLQYLGKWPAWRTSVLSKCLCPRCILQTAEPNTYERTP